MTSLTSTQHCLDHRALCGPDTLEQWKDIVSGDYTFKISLSMLCLKAAKQFIFLSTTSIL